MTRHIRRGNANTKLSSLDSGGAMMAAIYEQARRSGRGVGVLFAAVQELAKQNAELRQALRAQAEEFKRRLARARWRLRQHTAHDTIKYLTHTTGGRL